MGNHSSRKNSGLKYHGKKGRALSNTDDLNEPPMDSYDKLVAWLVEMAENDNSGIDKASFVNQIQNVCTKRKSKLRNQASWQTSCDSYTSTETPAVSKSSRSCEDIIDPNSRLRVPVSSRQTTFSEDEEDNELRKLSSESLYNDADRENDFDVVDPKEILLKKRKNFLTSGRAAHVLSSSVGNLVDSHGMLINDIRRKSSSMVIMQARGQHSVDILDRPELPQVTVQSSSEEKILDDELLDGNIADIMFAVEALWPKK
ncbi:uncharacterized protein LOC117324472 [Pecten maximus]|uniref:uncharacterized protein LOC117324472 n=1 Tax=Pecten maximus TaxID=6579 RepID=UPI0014589085|nr:uncharacterized protein LOC117324472 [Pecten maximus]